MRTLLAVLLLLSLPALAAEPQGAQTLTRREQRVLRLMELTGAANMGKQVMDGMLDTLGKDPKIPPGFIEKFKELAQPDALVRLIIPIYAEHLSETDVEAAIRFYETSAGQRLIAAQPVMVQQAMQVGQQWGIELAERAMQALQAERAAPPAPRDAPRKDTASP